METGSYGRERENILHLGRKGDWSWSIYAQKSIMGDYSSARHKIPSYENTENADVKITRSWGDAADLTLSYSVFSGRYTSKIFNFKKIESIPGSGILDKKIKNIFLTDGRKTENNVSLEYERKYQIRKITPLAFIGAAVRLLMTMILRLMMIDHGCLILERRVFLIVTVSNGMLKIL